MRKNSALICVVCGLVLLIIFGSGAQGAIIHVPGDQPTIQAGIDASVDGDTILVADGTYTGVGNMNIDTTGKAILIQSENGPETTIIDCENSGRGFIIQQDETPATIIRGLTIQNGFIQGDLGAAVKCLRASPTIDNCIFRENNVHTSDDHGGGAIGARESSMIVTNCMFVSNTASRNGGAVCYRYYCSPVIENCQFIQNDSRKGGAIYFDEYCSPVILNCLLDSNTADDGAGIYYGETTTGIIQDTTITGNTGREGGGIFVYRSAAPLISGCTIMDNFAGFGGGIYCSNRSNPIIGGEAGAGNYFQNNRAYDGVDIYIWEINETTINAGYNTFSGYHLSDYYVSPPEGFNLDNCISEMTPVTQDVFVSVDGDDTNDGLTSETPFRTIHHALSRIYGTETEPRSIHLASGTYELMTGQDATMLPMMNYISFIGEGSLDTILDCQTEGPGFSGHYDQGVSITGVTVTNAGRSGISSEYSDFILSDSHVTQNLGSGVNLWFSHADINGCVITENNGYAGIRIFGSEAEISHSEISRNVSASYEGGGGINCGYFSTIVIEDCDISNNISEDHAGGGVSVTIESSATLRNSRITGNEAYDEGGGIYIDDFLSGESVLVIDACEISNNTSEDGGGIFSYHASMTVTNSVISGNVATLGGGIYCNNCSETIIGGSDGNGNEFIDNNAGSGVDLYCSRIPSTMINSRYNLFSGYHLSDYYVTPQAAFDLTGCVSLMNPISQDVYVSPSGNDANDGLTSETAFRTITHANGVIYGSEVDPVTIHLDHGVFSPSTTGELFPISLMSHVAITGLSRDTTVIDAESSNCVLIGSYNSNITVSHLSITGGYGSYGAGISLINCDEVKLFDLEIAGNSGSDGGGLYASSSDLELEDSIIRDNTSNNSGAGMYLAASDLIMINTTVSGNTSQEDGGGVFCYGSDGRETVMANCRFIENRGLNGSGLFMDGRENSPFLITDSSFTGNEANEGGALHIYCDRKASASVTQCRFNGNESYQGGGLFLYCEQESSIDVMNCLFALNQADRKYNPFIPEAGAIYLMAERGSSAIFTNCTLVENSERRDGCAVRTYLEEEQDTRFINCIFWNDEPEEIISEGGIQPMVTYSLVRGGYPGEGNISADPLFVAGDNGNYYLRQDCDGSIPYSPCENSGSGPVESYCYETIPGTVCMDQLTTRTDNITDTGILDMGYHYPDTGMTSQGMQLILTDPSLEEGDLFNLHYYLYNPDSSDYHGDVWIILDIYGLYWFYPGWKSFDENGIDFKENVPVGPDSFYHETVLSFEWPIVDFSASGLRFYGAAFDTGTFNLFGDIQEIGWEFY